MLRAAVLIGTLLAGIASADAAPKCKKGKPCGNSCIAQDKTCRK